MKPFISVFIFHKGLFVVGIIGLVTIFNADRKALSEGWDNPVSMVFVLCIFLPISIIGIVFVVMTMADRYTTVTETSSLIRDRDFGLVVILHTGIVVVFTALLTLGFLFFFVFSKYRNGMSQKMIVNIGIISFCTVAIACAIEAFSALFLERRTTALLLERIHRLQGTP